MFSLAILNASVILSDQFLWALIMTSSGSCGFLPNSKQYRLKLVTLCLVQLYVYTDLFNESVHFILISLFLKEFVEFVLTLNLIFLLLYCPAGDMESFFISLFQTLSISPGKWFSSCFPWSCSMRFGMPNYFPWSWCMRFGIPNFNTKPL